MINNDRIVTDLINDEYFHKWIIDPDKACLDFWAHWENESAERQDCMVQARAILLSHKFKSSLISQTKKDMLWDQITDQIEKTSSIKKKQQQNTIGKMWYGIA